MNLPTPEQCIDLWNQYKTPLHIREHMQQVNRVAVYIADKLIKVGEHVTLNLVDRAALLHDTLRITEWEKLSFEYFPYTPTAEEIATWQAQRVQYPSTIPHSQVNYEVFKDEYPEMAQVILMHSIGSTPFLNTWEEKIVNYADRRVAHTQIVSVQERLREGSIRYARSGHGTGKDKRTLEQNNTIVQAIYALEQELFNRIGENPDSLPLYGIEQKENSKTTI